MKKHPLHHENNTRVVEFKCQMLYTYKRNAFKQVSLQFDLINRRKQDKNNEETSFNFSDFVFSNNGHIRKISYYDFGGC